MSMSFNRLRSQILFEAWCGCSDLSKWNSYVHKLENLTLDRSQASKLQAELTEDAKDIYLKGIQSLAEAIGSCRNNLFSWATVKAYYSVFYFLRSNLALRNYALIKNKSLYLVESVDGALPQKKGSNKYRNDHIGIINIYIDLYSTSDKLQSNSIDSLNSYEWLMEKRHQVHYREREFHDPSCPDFFSNLASSIATQRFEQQIENYINDSSFIFCFQPDHAMIALPLKVAMSCRDEFVNAGITLAPSREKILMLHKVACDPNCDFAHCIISKITSLPTP